MGHRAELQECQKELAEVKKSLRENGTFMGMGGEILQKHFLTLNEKENILLSLQLQNGAAKALPPAQGGNLLSSSGYGGSPTAAKGSFISKQNIVAKELPSGSIEAFNRERLPDVSAHLSRYEASPAESAKALRALAALAYANAKQVGDDSEVMPQILRSMELHPTEEHVQTNAIRALCNMAYDPEVALKRLSTPDVFRAFVGALVRNPAAKEVSAKSCEAMARVVAAEVSPETPKELTVLPEEGPLRVLFTLVSADAEEQAARDVIVQLVEQLISNEVATPDLLAERIVHTSRSCKGTGEDTAAWLALTKAIATKEISTLSECLVNRDAIRVAYEVMGSQIGHGPTQLAGIEAMSGLVGRRWVGLQRFAAVKGIERIETAMENHADVRLLQTKGIRALASGVAWPKEIQDSAGWTVKRGVELTKKAMAHKANEEGDELQTAGLEALKKYLDYSKCIDDVKAEDGDVLVQNVMARFPDKTQVQSHGKAILYVLGAK
jgi:hypothetical protein